MKNQLRLFSFTCFVILLVGAPIVVAAEPPNSSGAMLLLPESKAILDANAVSQLASSPYDDDNDDRAYDRSRGRRVTCESYSEQYNYCRTDIQGRIRLERQLSEAPCRHYDTWGADPDGGGIWVRNGCRAVFRVEPRRASRSRDDRRAERNYITCESKRANYSYCRTNTRGEVRLERQLSETPCREYYTWGADPDGGGVWVSDGCRAVFAVKSGRRSSEGRPQSNTEAILCRSKGLDYNYCSTGTHGRIRLVQELSDAACREYYTWGADPDGGGIWVDRGCSAEFVVDEY